MIRTLLLSLLLFLSGCASLPKCVSSFERSHGEDQGRILLYRIKQFLGGLSALDMYIDECIATTIARNEIQELYLPAGVYQVGAFDPLIGKYIGTQINVTKNETTIVKLHVYSDGYANFPEFTVVSESEALGDKIDGIENYIRTGK